MDGLSSLIRCLEQANLQGLQAEVEFAGTIFSSITAHINSRLQDTPRESVIRNEDSRRKDLMQAPKKELSNETQIFQENRQEDIYKVSKDELLDEHDVEPEGSISSQACSELDFQEKQTFEGPFDLGEDIKLLTPEVTISGVEAFVKHLVKEKATLLSSEEQLYIENSLNNAHQIALYAPQVLGKIVLPCQLCEFKTQSNGNPLSELRLHTIDIHFVCALCGAQFETNIDLLKHFEDVHKRNSKYFACRKTECHFKVRQDCRLRKMYCHIRNQHTDIVSACKVCKKTFIIWRSLKIHEFKKHNLGRELQKDQLKVCLQCGHRATGTNMITHTRNVHSVLPLLKCSLCHYETRKGEERMKKHEQMHSVEKMKCGLCNFSSRVSETLAKHRTKIHEKGGLLLCTSCNYKTGMMKRLVRHEQSHSKDKPYGCDKCDYKAKTDYSLKAHSFYHQDPKFNCDKCDYKSCSSANLSSHKTVKHSTVKHECEQCGNLFNYKRHLSRHQDTHEGGDMPCNKCDKKFYRKDKLNDHLRIEHQTPALKAIKLVSEFEDSQLLQNTKENNENLLRNHSCLQCPKTFTCSKHLSRHKNSVHSAVELTCQFCQKTFSRRDKMNVHINISCKLKV